jgi:hypothetical protein
MSSKGIVKVGRPPKSLSVRQGEVFHFRATEKEGNLIRKAMPPDKTLSEFLRETVIDSIKDK